MVVNCNRYLYARNGRIVKNCRFRSDDHKLHRNEHVTLYGTCWCYGSCWSYCSLYSKNISLWCFGSFISNVRSRCGSYHNVWRGWDFSSNLLGSRSLDGTLFENLYQVILKQKSTKPFLNGGVFIFPHIYKIYEKGS